MGEPVDLSVGREAASQISSQCSGEVTGGAVAINMPVTRQRLYPFSSWLTPWMAFQG